MKDKKATSARDRDRYETRAEKKSINAECTVTHNKMIMSKLDYSYKERRESKVPTKKTGVRFLMGVNVIFSCVRYDKKKKLTPGVRRKPI